MPVATAGKATYNRLFLANALGLLGTGVATVALALLAFELSADNAGAVLGTALAIKAAVNVIVAPVSSVIPGRKPRGSLLKSLALVRAAALLCLPFVDAVWQVYLLIAVFQSAAAASAAQYLAIVPDLLPDEAEYARAVGKSKIAYEAEGMLSPLVAMLLLAFTSHRGVFVAAVALFLIAAVLYHRLTLPAATRARQQALSQLATDARRLFGSPAMRGAMLLSAAAITIGAMVMVNTVVLARGVFDRDEQSAVIALGVFGAGGVIAALFLPRLTAGGAERSVMLMAGVSMTGLLISGAMLPGFYSMLGLWAALGAASTLAQLPVSTMISRTSTPGDRQGLYAVHFGVNHALLFVAYLAAGWIGAEAGFVAAFLGLGVFSLLLVALATWVWPRGATPPARATRQQ